MTAGGVPSVRSISAIQLVPALKRLSPPVIDFLTGGRPRTLESMLRYPDVGVRGIGERLILFAGLVTCALHVDRVRRKGAEAGDHRLRGYIESLLLRRTYSAALAVATIDRAQEPSIALLPVTGDRDALHVFLQLTRETPGNSFRARSECSLEQALNGILLRLHFLESIHLDPQSPNRLQLGDQSIETWPFVVWNGTAIKILHECWAEPSDDDVERLPNTFELESWRGLESRTEIVHAGSSEIRQVAEIAALSGIDAVEGAVDDRFRPELLVPLLAGTVHRRLPDLASYILKHASDGTKKKWVKEYLQSSWGKQPSDDEINKALKATNLVENAIVAGCVERDPIEVMTHYFSVEGTGIEACLLQFDPSGAPATIAAIDQRVRNFAEKLKPIWVETAESALDIRLIGERARLGALEVARALGFRVRDVEIRETISEHISRVRRFIDSLYNFDLDHQRKGAIHCSVVCEEILKFTIAFYRSVEYFDFRFESGISAGDMTSLADDSTIGRVRGQPLGRVLDEFQNLCAAYARGKQPPMLGDRGWMLEGLEQHFGKIDHQKSEKQRGPMWDFKEWRNKAVHNPEKLSPHDDLESLLKGLLSFLEWLRTPGRAGATQVYPAILHLNVLSTNRCGITTVKYELWEKNSGGVALYTHQPISATAGVFYGMPRHERSTRRLWMDPVLFGSEVIERALRGA